MSHDEHEASIIRYAIFGVTVVLLAMVGSCANCVNKQMEACKVCVKTVKNPESDCQSVCRP